MRKLANTMSSWLTIWLRTTCQRFSAILGGSGLLWLCINYALVIIPITVWQTNLRILDIEGIMSVPSSPTSHPFIGRLIGTIRREYLDQLFLWNKQDLERKLADFAQYYNQNRAHPSPNGKTPESVSSEVQPRCALLEHYSWHSHCNGLFQAPIAA